MVVRVSMVTESKTYLGNNDEHLNGRRLGPEMTMIERSVPTLNLVAFDDYYCTKHTR
jgi:hypothetical protein